MRKAVEDIFFDYSAGHEGFTSFMYCDILNLVTTGIGNRIDNGKNLGGGGNPLPSIQRARLNNEVSANAMAPALKLPWKLKAAGWNTRNPVAGELVSPAEIADAWTKVKRQNENVPDFSQQGGFKYAGLTNLTLDMQGIRDLFATTRNSFNTTLASRYPGYENWPADAQLAIMSMAWALGPAFNFSAFKVAVDKLDFRAAAAQSFFKGGGGTLEKRSGRNAENVIMFNNAADVLEKGLDLDLLFFPGTVASSPGVLPVDPFPKSSVNSTNLATPVIATGVFGVAGYGLYRLGKWKGWF